MISMKKLAVIVGSVVALLVVTLCASSIFETNVAGYVQVKQAAISGTLTVKSDPGMYLQMFGDIHTYKEASTYYFTADTETGESRDQSLPTQFNDGAKAKVSGSVRLLLPNNDSDAMINIHRKFKSMNGVMDRLVLPAMRKALFASGPHMSAAESYAERRNEFATLVEEQLLYGIIATEKESVVENDDLTGEDKTTYLLHKTTCKIEMYNPKCVNGYVRTQKSVFHEFDIRLTNFVIDDIVYPENVLAQIETQRAARMNIITKEAEAKEADARARKAIAEGRAKIAETRAVEEVAKTQMIVRAEASKAEAILAAEKVKAVAELEKEAAEFEKKKQILLGEGESTRKRLIMQADGALEKKLAALVTINANYANALAKAQPGALVPAFQMGTQSGGGSSATAFIDLLTAQAAKSLAIDTTIRK